MKRIHKQTICNLIEGFQKEKIIRLPKNAAVLSVSAQDTSIVVHYLFDAEEKESFTFKFLLFMTGEDLPKEVDSYSYLKTVDINGTVIHVFVDLTALEETPITEDKDQAI